MTALCFIDTETTGVHPGRKVWEIAMIRRDDTGETQRSFFVDVDLSEADPFGLSVGKFYERHPHGRELAGLPKIAAEDEVLVRVSAAMEVARLTHGAHLVGAVPHFDAEVLATLLRDHQMIPAWHYHLIDVEALAVGFLHGFDAGHPDEEISGPVYRLPWKSDDLSRACGIEPPGEAVRHTALGDAIWAMSLYDRIVSWPA